MRGSILAAVVVVLAGLPACSRAPALVGQVHGPAGGVADAEVLVLDSAHQEVQRARTDAAGRFALRGRLEARPHVLVVTKDGYQPLRSTVQLPVSGPLELALSRQAQVHGTVRLADGSVVPGATVLFRQGQHEVLRVTSGADGSYAATGLAPGLYTITAWHGRGDLVRQLPGFSVSAEASPAICDLELERALYQTDESGGEVKRPAVIVGFEIPESN
jgi:hypothetical protein